MNEHQTIEWKEVWRDEYLKWICGFANAQGGTLIIGKNDQGKLTGLPNARKLLEDIPNKVRDILGIVVDVNLHTEHQHDYLAIVVEAHPYPVSYKGEYHYRSGSTKQELKGVALDAFLLKKHGLRWDAVPVPTISITDCSPTAFQLFRAKAAKSGRISEDVLTDSNASLLENLQLHEGHYLKRATTLLFYDKPEKYVSGATIKLGFFISDDELRFQDEIHGNLFRQVDQTLDTLFTKYLKAYISYEGIQRVERFLFPPLALREALLNAVVHKDYSSGIPIQISIYEDRIVFWNYGQLPDHWTLERLLGKHPSNPFNPLIANTFFRCGYIESWGRGIEKIKRECEKWGIPSPEYDYGMSGLMLTFRANPAQLAESLGKTSVETSVETTKMSVKTPERILAILTENPNLTLTEVADMIGKTLRTVERATAKLAREERLRFIGSRKAGHWEVIP